jgi:Ser/Thr protein kinase RdoA (MazF antagonist)
MGRAPVPPDWPPLTNAEVIQLLSAASDSAAGDMSAVGRGGDVSAAGDGPVGGGGGASVTWWSPRPLSAAAVVSWRGTSLFLKRHHVSVRTVGQLEAEHAFAAHLRRRGQPVPAIVPLGGGATAARRGDFVYEAQQLADGIDLYRDAVSWSPFASRAHAHAAGAALARLHLAAADFAGPERPPAVLTDGCAITMAADPAGRLGRLLGRRPGLARSLAGRSWRDDFSRHLLSPMSRARPLCEGLPRQWGHGDWHPSNLTWTCSGPDAQVAAVLDLGLANRTFAVHDLAIALERSTVSWLDLAESGQASADIEAMDALLDGYESVRALSPPEAAALAEVLPVAHVEFALSEVEYFADVTGSAANAELAYDGYLLGHARWFAGPGGSAVLAHLRRRAARAGRVC